MIRVEPINSFVGARLSTPIVHGYLLDMTARFTHWWLRTMTVFVAGVATAIALQGVVSIAVIAETGSMLPTFQGGETVLVDETWFESSSINAGDIIVFDPPAAAHVTGDRNGAKRVIAREGQTVSFDDGHVFVDGIRLVEPYVRGVDTQAPEGAIPGCVRSQVNQCVVPDDHFFVMGDNRAPHGSLDSRAFGPIAGDSVEGRAIALLWPPTEARSL